MSLYRLTQYYFIKDVLGPVLFRPSQKKGKDPFQDRNPYLGPPLKSADRLREIMTRHYYLSRFAKGAKPVAWVTGGAPVELLRAFGFYTFYPETMGPCAGRKKWVPNCVAMLRTGGTTLIFAPMLGSTWGTPFPGKRRQGVCQNRIFSSAPITSVRRCFTGIRSFPMNGTFL